MTYYGRGGARWDVDVAMGDDLPLSWIVLGEGAQPFVWDGYEVNAIVHRVTDDDYLFYETDITVNGRLSVRLSSATTIGLGIGEHTQQLKLASSTGDPETATIHTWLSGQCRVRAPNTPKTEQDTPAFGVIVIDNVLGNGTITLEGGISGPPGPAGAPGGTLDGGLWDSDFDEGSIDGGEWEDFD